MAEISAMDGPSVASIISVVVAVAVVVVVDCGMMLFVLIEKLTGTKTAEKVSLVGNDFEGTLPESWCGQMDLYAEDVGCGLDIGCCEDCMGVCREGEDE